MNELLTRQEMEAECPGVYEILPAQLRDKLPARARASAQNAMIFRNGFDVMPGLVDGLFKQLRYIDGTDWPVWKLVACFYLVETRIGKSASMRAGEKIYSTMPWPPHVGGIQDALRFTVDAYQESHFKAPASVVGAWRVDEDSKGRMIMADATPYPDSLNEGVIAGICAKFSARHPSYELIDAATAKRNGGTVTRYEVRFDP